MSGSTSEGYHQRIEETSEGVKDVLFKNSRASEQSWWNSAIDALVSSTEALYSAPDNLRELYIISISSSLYKYYIRYIVHTGSTDLLLLTQRYRLLSSFLHCIVAPIQFDIFNICCIDEVL